MKEKRKLSFLIAAHNEEKIIGKTLENLRDLPYRNYEVLVGLDGCTDKTEEIVERFVRKSGKFKCIKLKSRSGKPEVIDKLVRDATGEIIVINDADWIFTVGDRKKLERFLSVFDDPKIGGIAESFPVEWDKKKMDSGNMGFRMVAYSSYFWFKFQKEKFTYRKKGLIYLKTPKMFLTNIFRRELYKKNFSLGDDFERTNYIMSKGKEIVIFDNIQMPRMKVVYNKIRMPELFKQKIRTAIARKQLIDQSKIKNFEKYYQSSGKYILKHSWKKGHSVGLLVTIWALLTMFATTCAKFKFGRTSTKEGWKMRFER